MLDANQPSAGIQHFQCVFTFISAPGFGIVLCVEFMGQNSSVNFNVSVHCEALNPPKCVQTMFWYPSMETQTTELCHRAAVVGGFLKVKVSGLSEKFQGWQVGWVFQGQRLFRLLSKGGIGPIRNPLIGLLDLFHRRKLTLDSLGKHLKISVFGIEHTEAASPSRPARPTSWMYDSTFGGGPA